MYRTGAVGALLDIYEQAISELKTVVQDIPEDVLTTVFDTQTTDEDCRSIQTILSHVVHSGFGYATNIHNLKGHTAQRPPKTFHTTVQAYLEDLSAVFAYFS